MRILERAGGSRPVVAIVVCAAGLVASACDGPRYDDERPPQFASRVARLHVSYRMVGQFGASRPLGDDSARADQPAVLRYVRAITEEHNGSILVVDNQTKRVVRFGPDGSARVAVPGGYGVTDGRFVNPNTLALDDRSRMFVLDNQLRRVSVFDSAGALQKTIPLMERDAFGLVIRDSLMWILRYFKSDSPDAVSIYDFDGRRLATAFPVSAREKAFGDAFTGVLAAAPNGDILFGHTTPGTWSVIDRAGHLLSLGHEVMPNATTRLEQVGRRTFEVHCPGGTISIGLVSTDTVGIVYATQYKRPPIRGPLYRGEEGPLVMNYFLDLFTSRGEYLGTSELLPGQRITAATFSPASHALLVGVQEPYPRVLKLAVAYSRLAGSNGAQP